MKYTSGIVEECCECVVVWIINNTSKHGGKNSVLHILIKIKRSNWIF